MSNNKTEIAIISPNAVLDIIYSNQDYSFSSKTFFSSSCLRGGGSGINLCRALNCLGIPSSVYTFLGGHAGKLAKNISKAEGINIDNSIETENETRVAAIQYGKGYKTMSVSPSPDFSSIDIKNLLITSKQSLTDAKFIFFGGSLSVDPKADDVLSSFLEPFSSKLIIDTRGETLKSLLRINPLCAKVDITDGVFTDCSDMDVMEIIKTNCLNFHKNGVQLIFSELETQLLAFYGGDTHLFPQFGNIKSRPYGRGDAFMAGIIYGLIHDFEIDSCIKAGLAAGNSYDKIHLGLGYIDFSLFQSELYTIMETL